jgi:DNA-binding SARP family transcriptional activator
MIGHSICQVCSAPAQARVPSVKRSIQVSLLNGFSLHLQGRELYLNSRKARALIAYLVLTPGMKETRDRLAGLLWGETADARARASLRQLIHHVRETFDREGLPAPYVDKDHVGLDETAFATDLDHTLASIDRGDLKGTLASETCVMHSFLRGHEDIDPSFCSWLAIKRESVRQLLIRRLEAQLCAPHTVEAIKRLARALLQIDPTHETACQTLMLACVASGNVGAALAAYKRLWNSLEEEYDIEPSAATQKLVVAIKMGNYQAASAGFGPDRSNEDVRCSGAADPIILLAPRRKAGCALIAHESPAKRSLALRRSLAYDCTACQPGSDNTDD